MKKMTSMVCALLMGFGVTTVSAEQQSASAISKKVEKRERFFNNMDIDKNGLLTQDEFLGFWTKAFNKSDRNKDGVLDQTEYHDARVFETLDTNKDGVISLDEDLVHRKRNYARYFKGGSGQGSSGASAQASSGASAQVSLDDFISKGRPGKGVRPKYDYTTTFTKMDADKDGYLTKAEYLAFWATYFEGRDKDDDEALDRTEHGHADSFNSFDQNRNGKIEPAEDQLLREKDFKGLDKDGDGSLSQSEFVR